MDKRYYVKCPKCGTIAWSEDPIDTNTTLVCTSPMPIRISGICGGSFSEIPTIEEIEEFEKAEEDNKNNK